MRRYKAKQRKRVICIAHKEEYAHIMGNLCRTYHRCVAKAQCVWDHLAHTMQIVSSFKNENSTICVAWYFGALQKPNLRRTSWPIRRKSAAHQLNIEPTSPLNIRPLNSLTLITYLASNSLTLRTPASQIRPITYSASNSPLPLSDSPLSLSLSTFVLSLCERTNDFSGRLQRTNIFAGSL